MTNEADARNQLEANGFVLLPGKLWRPPAEREVTAEEMAAVNYLVWNCGYEGFETNAMREGAAAFRSGILRDANPHGVGFDGGRPRIEWAWGWDTERGMAAIEVAATDYADNAWARAMTNGKAMEERFVGRASRSCGGQ